MKKSAQVSKYKVNKGKIPILVSAPHAFAHKRPSIEHNYKVEEKFTDTIAKKITQIIPVSSIFSTASQEFDPNFYPRKISPYKNEVASIVDSGRIEFMLDIHGLSETKAYDFGIYYPLKFYKSMRIARNMAEFLAQKELRGTTIQILNFPKTFGESLSECVASNSGVPAVQIEIARYIREDDYLLNVVATRIADFIKTLV